MSQEPNTKKKHWTERIPLFYHIAGLGRIRVLNRDEGNTFEQCFLSSIRYEIQNRSNDKLYYHEKDMSLRYWQEVEEIIDECLAESEQSTASFTKNLIERYTSRGLKEIALATLKAEAKVINAIYPMSAQTTSKIRRQREAEREKEQAKKQKRWNT